MAEKQGENWYIYESSQGEAGNQEDCGLGLVLSYISPVVEQHRVPKGLC